MYDLVDESWATVCYSCGPPYNSTIAVNAHESCMSPEPDTHADALVFFGATGDLAFQKIFPALQALTRRGHLDIPVIGVAKPEWTIDQLRARARESVTAHGGVDGDAFGRLASRLSYVAGDYQVLDTFERLR